jgi:hypothetical protein
MAVWPDGKLVTNMQMVFQFGYWTNDYLDLKTNTLGLFPTPDYSRCYLVCELWIGVPPQGSAQTLYRVSASIAHGLLATILTYRDLSVQHLCVLVVAGTAAVMQ